MRAAGGAAARGSGGGDCGARERAAPWLAPCSCLLIVCAELPPPSRVKGALNGIRVLTGMRQGTLTGVQLDWVALPCDLEERRDFSSADEEG